MERTKHEKKFGPIQQYRGTLLRPLIQQLRVQKQKSNEREHADAAWLLLYISSAFVTLLHIAMPLLSERSNGQDSVLLNIGGTGTPVPHWLTPQMHNVLSQRIHHVQVCNAMTLEEKRFNSSGTCHGTFLHIAVKTAADSHVIILVGNRFWQVTLFDMSNSTLASFSAISAKANARGGSGTTRGGHPPSRDARHREPIGARREDTMLHKHGQNKG
eukprot:4591478-Amphidinium_carterae.2